MRFVTTVVAVASMLGGGTALADNEPRLEVRFCPAGQLRPYPAESRRNIQSLVLQNVAILNRGTATAEVSEVDFELTQGEEATDIRRIRGAELQRLAVSGPKVQASGLLQLIPFQFCGTELIPEGVVLAGPVLQPNQAMLFTYQPFLYKGQRDALRLRVHARSGELVAEADAVLPIRSGVAKTSFVFPVTGTWFVAVGPTLHTGHRWGLAEEFGFDLAQLGAGTSSHRGAGGHFSDYYAYGKPVRAAAAGRVRAVVNDVAEDPKTLRRAGESDETYGQRVQQLQMELLAKGGAAAAGNYVLIGHGSAEYSLYAHLQPGSVAVKAGDMVESGQLLGRVGSSGNSTEPHLHFQVCDQPEPLSCAGIPVDFQGIALPYADYLRPLQSGDIVVAQ